MSWAALEGDPVSLKTLLASTREPLAALELDEVLDAIERAVFERRRAGDAPGTVVLRDESGGDKAEYVPVTTRVRRPGAGREAIPSPRRGAWAAR